VKQQQRQIMKYKIQIFGGDRCVIGYWRRFDNGEIALFDSRFAAEQTINCFSLDAIAVEVKTEKQ